MDNIGYQEICHFSVLVSKCIIYDEDKMFDLLNIRVLVNEKGIAKFMKSCIVLQLIKGNKWFHMRRIEVGERLILL